MTTKKIPIPVEAGVPACRFLIERPAGTEARPPGFGGRESLIFQYTAEVAPNPFFQCFGIYNDVMAVIQFADVTYRVGTATLVTGLSFEVEEGETLVLLGRSGSGKSTTLKLINHLLMPTVGSVQVNGKDTREWDPIALRRRIGYVIQDIGLFPHFSVFENVALVPRLEKWPAEKIRLRVTEVLELVDLDPIKFADRYPAQLSGGQRQRVGVARALCADPQILLLDEPFGALDPTTRSEIQNQFRVLQKQLGKTMVFVTHDVAEALLLGTRIGFMKEGKLLTPAPPPDFLKMDDPEISAFLAPVRSLLQFGSALTT